MSGRLVRRLRKLLTLSAGESGKSVRKLVRLLMRSEPLPRVPVARSKVPLRKLSTRPSMEDSHGCTSLLPELLFLWPLKFSEPKQQND